MILPVGLLGSLVLGSGETNRQEVEGYVARSTPRPVVRAEAGAAHKEEYDEIVMWGPPYGGGFYAGWLLAGMPEQWWRPVVGKQLKEVVYLG